MLSFLSVNASEDAGEDEDDDYEDVNDNLPKEPAAPAEDIKIEEPRGSQQQPDAWVQFPPSHPDVVIKAVFPDNASKSQFLSEYDFVCRVHVL